MRKGTLLLFFLFLVGLHLVPAQTFTPDAFTADGRKSSSWKSVENDSVEKTDVPRGFYLWNIDKRFGDIIPTTPDTLSHLFQNNNFTEGPTGRYNHLGNLGSPRMSRLYFDRTFDLTHDQYIFTQPYDFFLIQPDRLQFSNTLSPVANITYNECGNKNNGEDRIRAYFATNVNKRLGLGFILDYLYGRGYYQSQSTSQFNGTLFASYRGERYRMHAYFTGNHIKQAENGGIESDLYLTNPEAFPTKYGASDMPTKLSSVWQKMNINTLYLTHRYSLGQYRRNIDTLAMGAAFRSLVHKVGRDSANKVKQDTIYKPYFVPASSFVHTLRFDKNRRTFITHARNDAFFNDFFLRGDSASDRIDYLKVANTVAFEVDEGFRPWLKSGGRLFAQHEFERIQMPDSIAGSSQKRHRTFFQNYFTVGAQLMKRSGRYFHYNVLGEMTTSGKKWGIFNVIGNADLNLPIRHDTLRIQFDGRIANEEPSFFFRHYQTRNAWWDNDNLDKIFRTRLGGELSYKETKLNFHIETLQNYAYFASTATPVTSGTTTTYLHGVKVEQTSKNIQIIGATLSQNLHWKILHWDNELTFQTSSQKDILPLPIFSGYTNLYLKFRIAKVLATEFGADMRYFTSYYAPDYSPEVGQFSTQNTTSRTKVGNYPYLNVYANFDLKSCRFYVMASNVLANASNSNYFLTPHYPYNPFTIRLGISWTFYN